MRAAAYAAWALALTGCGQGQWLMNGFIDPTQVGRFNSPARNEIRGTLGILEEPLGIQDADEPDEADLEPLFEEPTLGSGDVVNIFMYDLMVPGEATPAQVQVSNTGFASLPVLGRIRVAGYTVPELEQELVRLIREKEILTEPEVQVVLIQSHAAQCSVVGFVSRPGPLAIMTPDFRLLEVVAAVGGIPETVDKIYVFRKSAGHDHAPPASEAAEPPDMHPSASNPVEQIRFTMSDFSPGPLGSALIRGGAAGAAQDVPAATINETEILATQPAGAGPEPYWDAVREEWVDAPPTQPAEATTAPASPPSTQAPEPAEPVAEEPASSEPAEEGAAPASPIRIIEIPRKELMNGDPRYNIVIRPHDIINVPPGQVGEYYMAGHVARPGAYRFGGQPLTVKEAIAAAGGFDVLAWPGRADLIRRVSQFEEQIIQLDLDAIFAGNAPDFYLRPNDILNVGTNAIAPFLAVVRNSFRMSYGFGFVYDRNFADEDSFFAQEQLRARRRAERQARGLPP